jgi:hypothetical protein
MPDEFVEPIKALDKSELREETELIVARISERDEIVDE